MDDGHGGKDTATVTITVNPPPNQAPTANPKSVSTTVCTPITFDITGSDPDRDPLTFTISQPSHGTAEPKFTAKVSALFSFGDIQSRLSRSTGTGFTGTDSFTFEVDDGHGGKDTATVTITVNPLPKCTTYCSSICFSKSSYIG